MNKKKMLAAVMGVAAVSLVVMSVTAGSFFANTPLYIFRMEQASSQMNFWPAAVNGFTYTTENGCTVSVCVAGCGVIPLDLKSQRDTECDETCFSTCPVTCWTCPSTCDATCPQTCDDPTCPYTCYETCPNTCEYTCDDPTCAYTCEQTCHYTCEKPCIP